MKNLILIRHGKATSNFMPDIERSLIEKGIKRTQKFTNKLKEQNIFPELIVSSPAKRALQTAEIIAQNFYYPKDSIQINPNFYFKSEDLVLNEIYSFDPNINTVFMIGHNPLWTELANRFSEQNIYHLRTSGIFGVSFNTNNWYEIETAPGKDLVLIN